MLIAGTCAHESLGGTYLKQIVGPALGLYGMEPVTHDSIWGAYLPNQTFVTGKLMALCQFARAPRSDMLAYNLIYATAMCAILYKWRLDKHNEPLGKTIEEIAAVWKEHYNTPAGKGTVKQFIENYNKFVGNEDKVKKKAAV